MCTCKWDSKSSCGTVTEKGDGNRGTELSLSRGTNRFPSPQKASVREQCCVTNRNQNKKKMTEILSVLNKSVLQLIVDIWGSLKLNLRKEARGRAKILGLVLP